MTESLSQFRIGRLPGWMAANRSRESAARQSRVTFRAGSSRNNPDSSKWATCWPSRFSSSRQPSDREDLGEGHLKTGDDTVVRKYFCLGTCSRRFARVVNRDNAALRVDDPYCGGPGLEPRAVMKASGCHLGQFSCDQLVASPVVGEAKKLRGCNPALGKASGHE